MANDMDLSIVKYIRNRRITVGGQQHSGWLPNGAATPLPTPLRELLCDFEIQFDGGGYLLCFQSTDLTYGGDYWYETLPEALEDGKRLFDLDPAEWMDDRAPPQPMSSQ